MSEWKEYTAKTKDEALTNAVVDLGVTYDKLEYEIIDEGSKGIFGIRSKPSVIKARVKYFSPEDTAREFLNKIFDAMNIEVELDINFDEESNTMSIDMSGSEMGLLIGKRGITLDSLQYLVSLVVNKSDEKYVKIKLDTENYRERRRETLENLARNLASKVKRTHRNMVLEPMNPYERRVIHSTLQKDKYVETHSEGDEPYRKVVITLKPGMDNGYGRGYGSYGNRNGGYKRRYNNYNRYEKKNINNYVESDENNEVNSDIED